MSELRKKYAAKGIESERKRAGGDDRAGENFGREGEAARTEE